MKIYCTIFFLILSCLPSLGQVNKFGHPVIRNYSPEEYGAAEQNWAAIQDNRGVMYFGNGENGILEYDGRTWRKIPIPNNSEVRSLAKDDEGTIYVGAVGEFGYLKPDAQGLLQFVSLYNFNREAIKITIIYKTYYSNHKIYFCSRKYIVAYDKQKTKVIDIDEQLVNYNFFSFIANNRFYVGSFVKGLMELINDSIVDAPNGAFFEKKDIYFILPNGSNRAIVGTGVGFYNYNQQTGEVSPYADKFNLTNNVLEESFPYHALKQPNGNFGFAFPGSTLYNYLEIGKNGYPIEALNTTIGLKDGSVSYLYNPSENSNEGSLWLTHFNGVSRAEIQSPFRRFGEESGIDGIIIDIKRYNGTLYLATLNGLYKQISYNGYIKFIQEPQVTSDAWSLEIFKNSETGKESLLIASSSGIYEINESGKVISISGQFKDIITIAGYKIYQSIIEPATVYIGLHMGIAEMKLVKGKWTCRKLNENKLRTRALSICEDKHNNLWLGTYVDGVAKYNTLTDSIAFYGLESGLPNLQVQALNFNNEVFCYTAKGVFKYNANTDKFTPTGLPGDPNLYDYGIDKFAQTDKGYIMGCFKNNTSWFQLVEPDRSGKFTINNIPFKRLPNKSNDGVFVDDDGTIWISKVKELYSYDPNKKRNYQVPYNALIRKILSKGDTILFSGTFYKKGENGKPIVSLVQNPEQVLKLPYRLNSLVFEFSATFYEKEEDTQFSYFLEGFNETWSSWNQEAKATFTNLWGGNYTFKVKARNIYGTESTIAEYKFSISPPWYRTILAWILYSVLFVVLTWALVRWNTRRLIAEKEELEGIVKERIAEIVAQKEEIVRISGELHAIDEMKLSFFANLSHEFRTPLTLILNPAKNLLEKAPYDQEYHKQLGYIYNNALKLQELTNQILELQKLDSGKLALKMENFDIISYCVSMVSSFESLCHKKNNVLKFKANHHSVFILSDKDKIGKILVNLLSNAMKFCFENTAVEIHIEIIENKFNVSVTDQGIGIPAIDIERVFKRYYQVPSDQQAGGTGIGLAYIKELTGFMNGNVIIDSVVDNGTTVKVTIPVEEYKIIDAASYEINIPDNLKQTPLEEFDIQENGNGKENENSVLIVEDNEELRFFISDLFKDDYAVYTARDGEDGIKVAFEHIPNLIISDVMMPKKDGFELCETLKLDERTSHIPIILLTAKDSEQSNLQGYQTGADDYIIKPFDSKMLSLKVKNIVATRQAIIKQFNCETNTLPSGAYSDIDKKFMQKCIQLIEANIGNAGFSVEQLAAELAFSKRNLYRKIQSLTNTNPGELIRNIRMQHALKLLKSTDIRVNEVALEVGYDNTVKFSQAFKKYHGILPSEIKDAN